MITNNDVLHLYVDIDRKLWTWISFRFFLFFSLLQILSLANQWIRSFRLKWSNKTNESVKRLLFSLISFVFFPSYMFNLSFSERKFSSFWWHFLSCLSISLDWNNSDKKVSSISFSSQLHSFYFVVESWSILERFRSTESNFNRFLISIEFFFLVQFWSILDSGFDEEKVSSIGF